MSDDMLILNVAHVMGVLHPVQKMWKKTGKKKAEVEVKMEVKEVDTFIPYTPVETFSSSARPLQKGFDSESYSHAFMPLRNAEFFYHRR
jgi:hypothetical protein